MIRKIKQIYIRRPVVIACWPGMGEVAFRAGLFLKESLPFLEFACLETKDFFRPQGIIVRSGILSIPPFPQEKFYYWKGEKSIQEIVLFISEAQPPLDKAYDYSLEIVRFIKSLRPREIITFASIPQAIDHTQEPNVWISSSHKDLLEEFKLYNTLVLTEGQISGLNGLILGVAREQGIKGVCLLGEIPLYMIQIENPQASKKVLEVLSRHLDLSLDLRVFDERKHFIDEQIEKILQMLKGESSKFQGPLDEKDIERIKKELSSYVKLPDSARKKIEELFKRAERDIRSASELKKELDKWGVYQEFEDRFLDLFRKKKPPQDH